MFAAHRKAGSIALQPTRGEFEIMRHIGEDAYSQMKGNGVNLGK